MNTKQKKLASEMLKQIKSDMNRYVKMANDPKVKPVPRELKFKDKMNKRLYDKTKEVTVLSYRQYYLAHQLYRKLLSENKNVNEPTLRKMSEIYITIKKKILPKFNDNIKDFASYVAYERIMTASLTKHGVAQTYELALKQSEDIKKALSGLKKAIKEKAPDIKLEESQELTEADIKSIIKAPFTFIKKAFMKSLSIIFEGWLFIFKKAKQIATPIKAKIDSVFKKFDKVVGRAVQNIIKSINPDFLETMKFLGVSEEDIEWQIGSYIRKGVMFIVMSTTFTAGIAIAVTTTYSALNKVITIGSGAETVEMLKDMLDQINDPKMEQMIAEL